MLVVILGKVLKRLYLGDLRPNEVRAGCTVTLWRSARLNLCRVFHALQVERVNESLRYTIPEVCIALTVFREELNLRIFGLFAALLFSKFFHVLIDERMNHVRDAATVAKPRLG